MNAVVHQMTPTAIPEREEIVLKPSKDFPREMIIEWDYRYGVRISVRAKNFQSLAWTRVDRSKVSLGAQRYTYEPKIILYTLYAAEASFPLSQREFETLRTKLGSRGVKVELPKDETP